jgi:hypothetical protein
MTVSFADYDGSDYGGRFPRKQPGRNRPQRRRFSNGCANRPAQRAHELLELNGEGELTNADREDMLDFVRVDEMMSLLKAKMKLKLKKASE